MRYYLFLTVTFLMNGVFLMTKNLRTVLVFCVVLSSLNAYAMDSSFPTATLPQEVRRCLLAINGAYKPYRTWVSFSDTIQPVPKESVVQHSGTKRRLPKQKPNLIPFFGIE